MGDWKIKCVAKETKLIKMNIRKWTVIFMAFFTGILIKIDFSFFYFGGIVLSL